MSHTHSRAPTAFSSQPPKTYTTHQECQFYVIDSENQEELHHNVYKSALAQPRFPKERCLSQPYVSSTDEHCLDLEIKAAQDEVKRLQKECNLLQSLINSMAAEQAKLSVEIRVNERRKSMDLSSQKVHKPSCPLSTNQINICTNIDPFRQGLQQILAKDYVSEEHQDISFTTPLLSRNQYFMLNQQKLDEATTVDINEQMKGEKRGQGSRKKSLKQKQNRSEVKGKLKKAVKVKYTKNK